MDENFCYWNFYRSNLLIFRYLETRSNTRLHLFSYRKGNISHNFGRGYRDYSNFSRNFSNNHNCIEFLFEDKTIVPSISFTRGNVNFAIDR